MNSSFATVLFAAIIAALIALPTPGPLPAETAPAVLARVDRLPIQPPGSYCSQQVWPNIAASCLRYTNDKQAVRGIRAIGDQG
jgi:hypothetical protein